MIRVEYYIAPGSTVLNYSFGQLRFCPAWMDENPYAPPPSLKGNRRVALRWLTALPFPILLWLSYGFGMWCDYEAFCLDLRLFGFWHPDARRWGYRTLPDFIASDLTFFWMHFAGLLGLVVFAFVAFPLRSRLCNWIVVCAAATYPFSVADGIGIALLKANVLTALFAWSVGGVFAWLSFGRCHTATTLGRRIAVIAFSGFFAILGVYGYLLE